MIDSLNAGQTCLQCRHYIKEGKRHDRLFGDVPIRSYCVKREETVKPATGENCGLFLRRAII